MKIIIVTSEIDENGGGLAKSCLKLYKLLIELNHDVKIILSSDYKVNIRNINIINTNFVVANGGYNKKLAKQIKLASILSIISKLINNTEIIIAFGGNFNAFFATELLNRLKNKPKFIISYRGSDINLSVFDNSSYRYNYLSLKKADIVISLSQEMLDKTKGIYFNSSILYKTIPNYFNISENLKFNKKQKNNNFIIGIGARHINEKKGIGNFLYALDILKSKFNVIFKIAGEIDIELLNNYKIIIEKLGLKENVYFLGNIEKDEYKQFILSCDLVIQISVFEGCSNFIAEAISLGVPFLSSPTGYFYEILKDDFNFLFFESLVVEDIAKSIILFFEKTDYNHVNQAIREIRQKTQYDLVKKEWNNILNTNKNFTIKSINNQSILSLLLHDIVQTNFSPIDTTSSYFERFCRVLYKKGYKLCSAIDYFNTQNKNNLIICTFDDAYEGVLKYAFPILTKYYFNATIFVPTKYIGKNNDWNYKDKIQRRHLNIDELKILYQNDWEIASHGCIHKSFLRLSTDELNKELKLSKINLSKYFGNIQSFAFPYGDTNDYITTIAKKYYQFIFNTNNGGTHFILDKHKIRRYNLDEIYKILQ